MEIHEFIKYRRKELGLSLQNVADAINYTPQAISKFENGSVNIDLRLVSFLLQVLNVSLKTFLNCDIENIEEYDNKGEFNQDKFSKTLRFLREKNKISQTDLALTLSLPKGKISKFETGESCPTIDEFIKLAKYFEIDYDEFYYGIIKKEEPIKIIEYKEKSRKRKVFENISLIFSSCLFVLTLSLGVYFSVINLNNGDENNEVLPPNEDENKPPKEELNNYFCVTYLYDLSNEKREEYVYKNDFAPKLTYIHKGYDLIGYYLNDTLFDFSTPITKDITIKGKLAKKEFDVLFYDYYGEMIKEEKVKYLEKATPPILKPISNLKFKKRNTENYLSVEENLSVFPIYDSFNTRVYFDLDGGEFLGEHIPFIDNFTFDKLSALPKIYKKGHAFKGFLCNGEVVDENIILTEAMTFKAYYEVNKYHILFENNLCNEIIVKYGSLVTLPIKDNNDREISKFFDSSNNEIPKSFTYEYEFDLTLTCVYDIDNFDFYISEKGEIEITNIKSLDLKNVNIPKEIKGTKIGKIKSNALSDNPNIETLTFESSSIEIESGAFKNLNNLKFIDFSKINEDSLFEKDIFINCSNINRIIVGKPTYKNVLKNYILSDYGLPQNNNLTLEFGDSVFQIPAYFNKGYGKVKTLKVGENTRAITSSSFDFETLKLEEFVPLVGLLECYLKLDETFKEGTISFQNQVDLYLDNEKTPLLKKLEFYQVNITTTAPLYVEELIFKDYEIGFTPNQLEFKGGIHAKKIIFNELFEVLSNNEPLIYPLDDSGVDVYFNGTNSVPETLLNFDRASDLSKTRIHFLEKN